MSKNTGGPAFPSGSHDRGMTLRDYFAVHATEEDIAPYIHTGAVVDKVVDDGYGHKRVTKTYETRTREAARYCYADAMIKAREA